MHIEECLKWISVVDKRYQNAARDIKPNQGSYVLVQNIKF